MDDLSTLPLAIQDASGHEVQAAGELILFTVLGDAAFGFAGERGVVEWYAAPVLSKDGKPQIAHVAEFVFHVPGLGELGHRREHPVCRALNCAHHLYLDCDTGASTKRRPRFPGAKALQEVYARMFEDLDKVMTQLGKTAQFTSVAHALVGGNRARLLNAA